jgi:hypothetical protein
MLTKLQKEFIDKNKDSTPDLIELTRSVFMDDSLDGRTKEGRAVRAYLAEIGADYNTTKHDRVESVDLTKDHKEFIKNNCFVGLSSVRLAQLAFKDESIKSLSTHHRAVNEYVKTLQDEQGSCENEGLTKSYNVKKYSSPEKDEEVLQKINDATHNGIDFEKMNHEERECVKSLKRFLKSPRFKMIMNNYASLEDRELFEYEFIRSTWDKYDLTSDEINLYINVCTDYIQLKNISHQIQKLNIMFDEIENQQELTVRYAEVLKTKNDEYDKCEKRMESLIKKLNGDRAQRIRNKHDEHASILSLVRSFQLEEERNRMVEIADMQKTIINEEAEKLESMDAWKSRILGLRKTDIV